ncbi:hypothetical protein M0813_26737 [Anaeramoeba flamelloides]|uniref:Uncharacterized protein n=1 Tax=Anaeramoeba flamelloides TaxID=1746091 RepID=A0ABQ8XZB2_9EUKA|nr:hypothetical protein M0813_26737 [Anaeramoeba flamelloides]
MGNEIPTTVLKKERKTYSKFIKKQPTALVLLDSNCCWVDVNRVMLRRLQMKKKSKLFKLNLKDLFPLTQPKKEKSSVQLFMKAFRKVIRTKEDLSDFVMEFSTPKGLTGWVSLNFSIFPIAKNDICQITVSSIKNITAHKPKERQVLETREIYSDYEPKKKTKKPSKLTRITSHHNKMGSSPLLFSNYNVRRSHSETEKTGKLVPRRKLRYEQESSVIEKSQEPKRFVTKKQSKELEELKTSLNLIPNNKIKHSFLDLLNLKSLGDENIIQFEGTSSGNDSKNEEKENENKNKNKNKNENENENGQEKKARTVYLSRSLTDNEKYTHQDLLPQETKSKSGINETHTELELHCCSIDELLKIPLFMCSEQDCERIARSLENIQNIHEKAFNNKNQLCQKISEELLNDRKKNKSKLDEFEKRLFSILEGLQKEKQIKRNLLQENRLTKSNLKELSLLAKKAFNLVSQKEIQNENLHKFLNDLSKIL